MQVEEKDKDCISYGGEDEQVKLRSKVEDGSRLKDRRALPATTSTIVMRMTSIPKVAARVERKASLNL